MCRLRCQCAWRRLQSARKNETGKPIEWYAAAAPALNRQLTRGHVNGRSRPAHFTLNFGPQPSGRLTRAASGIGARRVRSSSAVDPAYLSACTATEKADRARRPNLPAGVYLPPPDFDRSITFAPMNQEHAFCLEPRSCSASCCPSGGQPSAFPLFVEIGRLLSASPHLLNVTTPCVGGDVGALTTAVMGFESARS